jgi:hypothetical protein
VRDRACGRTGDRVGALAVLQNAGGPAEGIVVNQRARRASMAWALTALALAAGQALAITYEENLDDDPKLSIELRLQRLDKRSKRLLEREQAIRETYGTLEKTIASGNGAVSELQEKRRRFEIAADSTTVRGAVGEGAPRGLAWHCSRAREIVPQLTRLATAAAAALKGHHAQLNTIEVGAEDADAALQTQYSSFGAAIAAGPLEPEELERLRADIKEIETGLPQAWGSYTTLRQMADETDKKSTLLQSIVAVGQLADDIDLQIARYLDDHKGIREALAGITVEYATDVAWRDSIQQRWAGSQLPGPAGTEPFEIALNARNVAGSWRRVVEEPKEGTGSAALLALINASKACGAWEQPPRDFTAARAAAGRPLEEQLVRIDEAYAARAEQIRQGRSKAEQIRRTNEQIVVDLNRKVAGFKPRDASESELLEKVNALRRDAAAEVDRMKRAEATLGSEARVVDEQRAATTATRAGLLALFNSSGE